MVPKSNSGSLKRVNVRGRGQIMNAYRHVQMTLLNSQHVINAKESGLV